MTGPRFSGANQNNWNVPLEVAGFGKRYRPNRPWAIRDVSLSVPSGSITALVGPNGAGKSTLLRACLGFEQPTEGCLLVCGHDPQRERAAAVNSVGYIPQASALYRDLTVNDHLVMAAAARQEFDAGYAVERLGNARLTTDRVIGELSGGEQAQVGLALAISTGAPLLILDEPLAALDPFARREFLNTLVDHVRNRGATAMLSSHIVTDIEQACDRLIVLGNGRLLLDAEIARARSEFVTIGADQLDGRASVGLFTGPSAEELALVHGSTEGRRASLEEIVLGHLAMARSDPAEVEAP